MARLPFDRDQLMLLLAINPFALACHPGLPPCATNLATGKAARIIGHSPFEPLRRCSNVGNETDHNERGLSQWLREDCWSE